MNFIDDYGKKHKSRELSYEEEQEIRRCYLVWPNGESIRSIARRFGISQEEVEYIGGKSRGQMGEGK